MAILIFIANKIQEKTSQIIDQIQKWIQYFEIKLAYSLGLELLKIYDKVVTSNVSFISQYKQAQSNINTKLSPEPRKFQT